jgi:hyperosmotically inducible protein
MNRNLFRKAVLLDTLFAAGLAFGLAISMPGFAADVAAPPGSGTISDAGITANVKQRLASVQSLKGADIRVSTTDGVVTLSGTVSDPHAKFAAVAAVISMEGVRVLDDELKTPPTHRMVAETKTAKVTAKHEASDSRITADVQELLADRIPAHYKVDVTTTRGVVFLKGDLADGDMIERVRGMVVKVDGVKSVNMNGVDAPFITMAY